MGPAVLLHVGTGFPQLGITGQSSPDLMRRRGGSLKTALAAGIRLSVAVEDLLLHQPNRRMSAPPGPEESEVSGENRTVVFQCQREINAIPQGQLVLQRQIERAEESRAHVE